ncbi:MAG: DUF438 domain-containing protein [Proteobacteria bacterium]|nr:DUF438 domain-containing protein [Pseudomonadota bacterium]
MMKISSKTTIADLLKAYPFLADFLVAYHPKFSLLKSKVAQATMAKVATLQRVSGIGEVPLDKLIKDIAAEIERQTKNTVEIETGVEVEEISREERTAALKKIILDLHDGAPFDDVKERFQELVFNVEPAEIVAMEQQLIKEGLAAEKLQHLSDLHMEIFRDALDEQETPDVAAGHPVHTFIEENDVFTMVAGDMDLLLQQLRLEGTAAKLTELKPPLQKALDQLSKVEIHYQRKENQLFPFLEKHDITGPSQVMWGVHDDIRAQMKQTVAAFEAGQIDALLEKGMAFKRAVVDMIVKENSILFPLALETLDESEWVAIRKGESDIGYAFMPPAVDWPGTGDDAQHADVVEETDKDSDRLDLDTGRLRLDQINMMLKHLPVDVTYVDENDQVQYFSAGKERIFPRSPGIIGREVQNCHPPKSLDIVNRIVSEFKNGSKNEAEFWINLQGRLLYIRYFAIRSAENAYCGTLEVSQDITEIKSIEGERRLLDWDDA